MRKTVLAALLAMIGTALWAADASAEPLGSKAAKKLLFPAKGAEVEVLPVDFLSASDKQVLETVGKAQKYYGAIAAAPDEGLLSEATMAAADFHDVGAAKVAALAGCNEKRKGGGKCVVVALIRPRGWKEGRALQLNRDATAGFRKFRRGRAPRALAISRTTGEWSFAKGAGAREEAVKTCNETTKGANDCQVVVAD